MDNKEKQTFGQKIRTLRLAAKLSQRSLSEKVGINFTYLSKIENDVLTSPAVDVILRLAEALSADKDELLSLAGKVPSDITSQILNDPDLLKSIAGGRLLKVDRKFSGENGEFGKLLRQLREKAGLSQSELADLIGVSFTYLSKIENGVKPAPSEKVILRLSEILKTDSDTMLTAAGKVPVDIINSLKNQETLQVLKKYIYKRKQNTVRRTRIMETVKSMFSFKSLSRAALPVLLVIAVAGSLWFGSPTPTKALQMTIDNQPTGYMTLPYTFSVTVTIEAGELLPIDSVDLSIFKADDPLNYVASYPGLPVSDGGQATYPDTGSGSAKVLAYAPNLSILNGDGFVTWKGYGYNFTTADGYTGPSTITYTVEWTPPALWPAGNYSIEATVNAQTSAFTVNSAFALAQATMVAVTSVNEAIDSVGYAVVQVKIDDIIDPSTKQTVQLNGGLGTYSAQIILPDGGIEVLGVNGTAATGPVTYNALTGEFSVASLVAPMQPSNTTVAEIVVKLIGNNTSYHNIAVAFTHIGAANDLTTNVPNDGSDGIAFMRGDANEDGLSGIGDALFIAQYLVEQKTYAEIGAVNGACVSHDNVNGDVIGIGDALFVAQFLVDQKDGYFLTK